ncbi:MAG: preprotein translocase subunit SecY, partial [Proteobacteria bacterium]|nr:preprotein translocase subunit SecY [Pseudomonadota bacterium]
MNSILRNPEIRNKILFTLFIILIFRILSHIPVPGINIASVKAFVSSNQLLGMFDIFSGGGLKNFSIVTLGLAPYINASIIVQLFTALVPSLEELSKEGETGREKLNEYTKYLTLPIAIVQSLGIYALFKSQGILPDLSRIDLTILILSMMAGTYILLWVSDLLTEKGLGNGVSLLIFVGIISAIPNSSVQFFGLLNSENLINAIFLVIALLAVIASVVYVNEGVKNIPLEYGRRMTAGGSRVTSSLPLKVNQVGVIPVIFAVSIVLLPSLLVAPLASSDKPYLKDLSNFLFENFQSNSFLYNFVTFILVVAFTYFYTSIQFNPEKISDDIKKRGGFIPGVRPGLNTTSYLKNVINKITLGGGLFLGFIAIMPYLIHLFIGFSSFAIG